MQQSYPETVYRPVVLAQPAPGPLAHGLLGALPARAIRNMALSGAITFCVVGVAGGFWIAAKYFESRIAAAENRANDAQQARQQAEDRLSAQLDQTAKFCQAALSGQPQAPSPEAIASQPKP